MIVDEIAYILTLSTITAIKSFIAQAPGANVINFRDMLECSSLAILSSLV